MKALPVESLGLVEIGGVGEMIYQAVRFPEYCPEYDQEEKEDYIVPLFTVMQPPVSDTFPRMTGQGLLASLCNLYKKVNDPNGKESITNLVWEWCRNNIHPYDTDELTAELETAKFYDYGDTMRFRRMGAFPVKRFLDDLCRLGTTFEYYQALNAAISNGDISSCRALYYEGRVCDSMPFMERYGQYENEEDYLAALKVDLDYHTGIVLERIPDFRMRLKKDKKKGTIQFGADVQSVFDICWYTFARMIADVAPPVDEDLDYLESTGSILSCLCCGNYFVRRSGSQRYCNDPQCQAERNKRKSRAYYARKKKSIL